MEPRLSQDQMEYSVENHGKQEVFVEFPIPNK